MVPIFNLEFQNAKNFFTCFGLVATLGEVIKALKILMAAHEKALKLITSNCCLQLWLNAYAFALDINEPEHSKISNKWACETLISNVSSI